MGWFRRRRAGIGLRRVRESVRVGFATRRVWPDGTHDFAGFYPTSARAGWFAVGDHRYWRKGPWRPVSFSVVPISVNDFVLHGKRRLCKAPDCPTAVSESALSLMDGSGVWG
jgi:hypothetical protein